MAGDNAGPGVTTMNRKAKQKTAAVKFTAGLVLEVLGFLLVKEVIYTDAEVDWISV